MTIHKQHFASLTAVVDYINATPRNWSIKSSEAGDRDYSWDLSAGYQGACKLASLGWQQGARNLATGLERLRPQATAHYKRYAVSGQRLSVVRYVTGNPRCMVKKATDQNAKPAIRLAVNVCANAGTTAENMSNYGLAIASYVEQLEQAGYKVEVLAVIPDKLDAQRIKRAVYSWTVKGLYDRMNFSDMAFSIGHPACFRRLGFALIERTPSETVYGYGAASDIKPTDLPDGNYIILNGMPQSNQHSTTPEKALSHIAKVISEAMQKQGLL
jgi:hypothetical protein